MEQLAQRIEDRSARVAVIGLGYVGLPLLRSFFDAGLPVLGLDTDPSKVERLRRGENYLGHLGADYAADMAKSQRFEVSSDFDRLAAADCILIAVPTPLGPHREPDLRFVEGTADAIAARLRPGQLVVLESTTYPGTTGEVVLPRLEVSGLQAGRDFAVAYSPEREDPGRTDRSARSIPKLVGAVDGTPAGDGGALDLAARLYETAFEQVRRVSSAETAEAAKILENVYRAVNIALVNELKTVFTRMGLDIWEVVDAASTKPFGFQPFYPGPGLGGHCIPIDPFYLSWKAQELGLHTRFIELAGETNRSMPEYVVRRAMLALNGHGKAVRGARVLVIGLAYKPNVDDVRESPSLELIEDLRELGAEVFYHDPHVPRTHRMREYDLGMESVPLSAETLRASDLVIVATDHEACDWELVARESALVLDTRGRMRRLTDVKAEVVTA
jgi:UDP-N-acetyl-D-glucosamine dehydrogenase